MPEIQSLKDYLRIICTEVNTAVSSVSANSVQLMKVSSVRLQLGGEADSIPEEIKVDVLESGLSTEPETKNWQFEILMSPDIANNLDYQGPFGEQALDVIQGIGTKWKNMLENWGITTIQQLARLEKKYLIHLGKTCSISLSHLLEFQLRARLASFPVPDLKPTKLDSMSIYECALMTSKSLLKAADSDSFSKNVSDALENYLSIIITAVNDRILREKTIADLRL